MERSALKQRREASRGVVRDLANIVRFELQRHLPRFEAADVEQGGDHVAHVVGAALGLGDVLGLSWGQFAGRHPSESVDVAGHDCQRRTQIVHDHVREIVATREGRPEPNFFDSLESEVRDEGKENAGIQGENRPEAR